MAMMGSLAAGLGQSLWRSGQATGVLQDIDGSDQAHLHAARFATYRCMISIRCSSGFDDVEVHVGADVRVVVHVFASKAKQAQEVVFVAGIVGQL